MDDVHRESLSIAHGKEMAKGMARARTLAKARAEANDPRAEM